MAPDPTNSIQIVLNGEALQVPSGLTLAGLLEHLGVAPDRVAVEFEEKIVRRPDWAATAVGPGARVEIVHFVGGG